MVAGNPRCSTSTQKGAAYTLRTALCLLMAFLLATCMVPFTSSAIAEDSNSSSYITGNVSDLQIASSDNEFNVGFPSATNSISDLQVVLNYSDNLFATSSSTYNDKLGYASVCLAAAAGNSSAEASYATKGKNIIAFLGEGGIGCEDIQLNPGYDAAPLKESNIGVAIGHKDIELAKNGTNKTYKLFVVGVRGISYEAEWASNLLVGNSGDHQGFAEARDSVLGFILPYIESNTQPGDNVKIWIAGYSRGGAVANLVGGWFDTWLKEATTISETTPEVQYATTYNEALMRNTIASTYDLTGRNLSTSDIYCYTVSTPQGADKAHVDANNQYCVGIHNLINPDDWIPQVGMNWWNFARYGTDHDISSTDRSGAINRDIPMLPSKSEALTSMIQRLKTINSGAAYTAAWFKQYYFSVWKMSILEDTGGDGNTYISQKSELVGKQGRYFEEFGRFVTGALEANARSEYVSQYQADFSYLAKILMGLPVQKTAKLGTTFKSHLTKALRTQLNKPELSLDNIGGDALSVLVLILSNDQGFKTVCYNTLKGTLDELETTYDNAAVESAAATLAKAIKGIVKADGQNFYHLVTLYKNSSGVAQAHFPEMVLAWWEGSDKHPVEPKKLNKVALRFYDNKDGNFIANDDQLVFSHDIYEGDMLYVSDEEQPVVDGIAIDDGTCYYNAPVREGYTFAGWQTTSEAQYAEFGEYYGTEDSVYYGDFDSADIQDGTCNLFAVWNFNGDDIEEVVANMTTEEKISQMIVPAFRTWDTVNVTDLQAVPELAQALQAHNYGGVILYSANISNVEQTVRLTSALQANNAKSSYIPYLMCVDGEGGVVTRLTMGTRMTGSMAIGATGDSAASNATTTGKIIGEEVAAAGFNVDFAPDIDVNCNAANPVIGTRAFSDDAQTVSTLGINFADGLASNGVIPTYKHFPGHGDTGSDSHIDVASVTKTYDELKQTELIPFESAIAHGADMIMTAHVTLPKIDDEVTFADGTVGYYPATMSKKALTDILRNDMGYQGVIVTDALEMEALSKVKIVEGELGTAQYSANLAIEIVEAGTDILLLPKDLKDASAATFYNDYIDALVAYADTHEDFAKRVDESVTRILKLKEKYDILDMDVSGDGVDQKIAQAEATIGSEAHHATETEIAKDAITLLKNEAYTLPLSGHEGNVVIFGRDSDHLKTINYAISQMQATGLIDNEAYVVDLESGTTTGSPSSKMKITIGFYRDYPEGGNPVVHYTDEMKQAVAEAQTVVAFSVNYSLSALQPTADQYQGVSQIMADTHAAGAKFVLLSNNLPYDAARYQDADAIMCCYMSAGLDSDPTDKSTGKLGAYNANVVCSLSSMFDAFAPDGTLPVNIPSITVANDGTASYSGQTLYERGSGLLSYNYAVIEGAEGEFEQGSSSTLYFKTNARHDKLINVNVDGEAINESNYSIQAGSTKLELNTNYLNTLAAGTHQLDLMYDYENGQFTVSTTFIVKGTPTPTPEPNTPVKSGNTRSPTTGDMVPVFAIAIVALVALVAIVIALIARRRSTPKK